MAASTIPAGYRFPLLPAATFALFKRRQWRLRAPPQMWHLTSGLIGTAEYCASGSTTPHSVSNGAQSLVCLAHVSRLIAR